RITQQRAVELRPREPNRSGWEDARVVPRRRRHQWLPLLETITCTRLSTWYSHARQRVGSSADGLAWCGRYSANAFASSSSICVSLSPCLSDVTSDASLAVFDSSSSICVTPSLCLSDVTSDASSLLDDSGSGGCSQRCHTPSPELVTSPRRLSRVSRFLT